MEMVAERVAYSRYKAALDLDGQVRHLHGPASATWHQSRAMAVMSVVAGAGAVIASSWVLFLWSFTRSDQIVVGVAGACLASWFAASRMRPTGLAADRDGVHVQRGKASGRFPAADIAAVDVRWMDVKDAIGGTYEAVASLRLSSGDLFPVFRGHSALVSEAASKLAGALRKPVEDALKRTP